MATTVIKDGFSVIAFYKSYELTTEKRVQYSVDKKRKQVNIVKCDLNVGIRQKIAKDNNFTNYNLQITN